MQGFAPQQMDMRLCGSRGATQLASISGHRVLHAIHHVHNNIQRNVVCASGASGVKLPATHLQASLAALQQLEATKGANSEFIHTLYEGMFFCDLLA